MGTHNDLPFGTGALSGGGLGQGTVTRALYYYLYAGEFRSVGMVTREFEVVNRFAGPTDGGSVRPACPSRIQLSTT